jgi:hypothetical protein
MVIDALVIAAAHNTTIHDTDECGDEHTQILIHANPQT